MPRAFVCSAAVLSQGIGPSCARFWLDQNRDHRIFNCGRSCRRWHLGPGVDWDVPFGPGHLRLGPERCNGWRSRRERQRSVEKCWSRGRIVSALLMPGAGECLPSVEPPNLVAITMDPVAGARKRPIPFDTALHQQQSHFMKGASRGSSKSPRPEPGAEVLMSRASAHRRCQAISPPPSRLPSSPCWPWGR